MKLLIAPCTLLLCVACTSTKPVPEKPAREPQLADNLVQDRVVADLILGQVTAVERQQLQDISGEQQSRWLACGALEGVRAEYHPAGEPEVKLFATLVSFGSALGAYCAYTPGRTAQAERVPELEASFEDGPLMRTWRFVHLVQVDSEHMEQQKELARGLLRAIVARLPGEIPPSIPGASLLPETSLLAGSEVVVPAEVLPGFNALALVADVHCGKKTAKAVVAQFASPEDANKALEAYHGVALEDFQEVTPFERAGAKGLKFKGRKLTNVVFATGPNIVGLIEMKRLRACDEPLMEVAARAAP